MATISSVSLHYFPTGHITDHDIAGLAATVNSYDGPEWQGWTRLYNLTFLVSLVWSFLLFWGVNVLFPIQGLGEDGPFEGGSFVVGLDVADGSSQGDVEQGKVKNEVETNTALA
jgi:nucleobase:cation symporter-1, NCS1 family